jgi:hypothetical protein
MILKTSNTKPARAETGMADLPFQSVARLTGCGTKQELEKLVEEHANGTEPDD